MHSFKYVRIVAWKKPKPDCQSVANVNHNPFATLSVPFPFPLFHSLFPHSIPFPSPFALSCA